MPIGIFDSGFGGLTVMKEIVRVLPQYDYVYLGDNARAPYGPRSFETIYKYTLQVVKWFFERDCALVILACNTASAKALRTIQQQDLPKLDPKRRVLGIIRPVTENANLFSQSKHIGILGTEGTVSSRSYVIEIQKFFPDLMVTQEACPMWVPLIENGEHESPGADYFVQKHIHRILQSDPLIDALVLGCTHYPLLMNKIKKYLPPHVKVISQGELVATSLAEYLQRHPEIEQRCEKNGQRVYYTTEAPETFNATANLFCDKPIQALHTSLEGY
ncbi:MAG TPA: glutamate racemase [Bacteroidales bacterium]|nr:glutamate racemase [Bacteroidales bacterium]HOK99023.1 glutamate racemase [Bacteroidales bacterium]HPO65854.1 glutamate racemase [Bacteroidales bacterium]